MNTFSEKIVLARKNKNMTQRELAEKLEISATRLNYWEKGKREPDVKMIKKLSEILEISADYLIGRMAENETYQSNYDSSDTPKILEKYNSLNSLGQQKADDYITDLSENPKYTK